MSYPPVVTASEPPADTAATMVVESVAPGGDGATVDVAAPARTLATQTAHVLLKTEDVIRSGNIALVLSALAAVGVIDELVVLRSGMRSLRLIAIVALMLVMILGITVRALRRARDAVRLAVTLVFGSLLVGAYFIESLHLGVFSSFQAVIVLALGVYGLEGRQHLVVPFAVVTFGLFAVPGLLIALDVVPDPGIFGVGTATTSERIMSVASQLVVYTAVLLFARRTRRSMQSMVERSNQAMLQASQDAALLAEANQNLDVVLRAGAGKGGRYTGTMVGSFKLGTVVGRGAMGEVYSAERLSDGRLAAVKLLTDHALGDEALVKRFLREADIVSKLRVPNVVELLEAGSTADGAPYLAMELLVGHDLAWHLRQRTRLPLADVVTMVEQIALGLEAAHAAGIVHRDLKPSNLFLHEREPPAAPVWKILDFGVGKLRDSGGTLTEGALVGTLGYMAPEQIQSATADARSDVFALGVVAYRTLTGHPPFGVEQVRAMFEVVSRQPSAPSTILRGVPPDVDRAIAIALAKKAEERFASAAELARTLEAASRDELPSAVRARADGLLRAHPWGSVRDPSTW